MKKFQKPGERMAAQKTPKSQEFKDRVSEGMREYWRREREAYLKNQTTNSLPID